MQYPPKDFGAPNQKLPLREKSPQGCLIGLEPLTIHFHKNFYLKIYYPDQEKIIQMYIIQQEQINDMRFFLTLFFIH